MHDGAAGQGKANRAGKTKGHTGNSPPVAPTGDSGQPNSGRIKQAQAAAAM